MCLNVFYETHKKNLKTTLLSKKNGAKSLVKNCIFKKFIYSEKATKFCEIFSLLFYVVPVESKVEISQNFVAISEYINFKNKFILLLGTTKK